MIPQEIQKVIQAAHTESRLAKNARQAFTWRVKTLLLHLVACSGLNITAACELLDSEFEDSVQPRFRPRPAVLEALKDLSRPAPPETIELTPALGLHLRTFLPAARKEAKIKEGKNCPVICKPDGTAYSRSTLRKHIQELVRSTVPQPLDLDPDHPCQRTLCNICPIYSRLSFLAEPSSK